MALDGHSDGRGRRLPARAVHTEAVADNSPPTLLDRAWQFAYRLGFPVARAWWHLRQRPHEGALVAIHVGPDLLLVRSSYRRAWNFPGGGVRRQETPAQAAARELREEIGLAMDLTEPPNLFTGIWDGRLDGVHVFELHLDGLPRLRLDNREIVEAQLFAPGELGGLAVTGPVAAYLASGNTPQHAPTS